MCVSKHEKNYWNRYFKVTFAILCLCLSACRSGGSGGASGAAGGGSAGIGGGSAPSTPLGPEVHEVQIPLVATDLLRTIEFPAYSGAAPLTKVKVEVVLSPVASLTSTGNGNGLNYSCTANSNFTFAVTGLGRLANFSHANNRNASVSATSAGDLPVTANYAIPEYSLSQEFNLETDLAMLDEFAGSDTLSLEVSERVSVAVNCFNGSGGFSHRSHASGFVRITYDNSNIP